MTARPMTPAAEPQAEPRKPAIPADPADIEIMETSEYPGEAAERIAERRGVSFAEAVDLVRCWEVSL